MSRGEEEFPLTKKLIYFDNAAQGAMPASTIKVMEEYVKDRCGWLRGEEDWSDGMGRWSGRVEASKGHFAQIIGAKPDEVAFVPNTTTGINTVFSMLPLKRGQNIVTTSISYPMGAAVTLKQKERGVEARFAENRNGEIGIQDFEKVVDDKTAAVLVDQSGWYNGLLHDLKAIAEVAHAHGSYLVVDAVQSAGAHAHDVDRNGVDFLAVSTYKWLLGGPYSQSVGFLYVNGKHADAFQPMFVGNQTIEDAQLDTNMYDRFDLYGLKYKKGVSRLQIYPRCEFSYVAVENSMRLLLGIGIRNVERRIRKLDTMLADGLTKSGFKLQSPADEKRRLYINVKVDNNRELEKELYRNRIAVSARVGGLRIAPHFYNREEEVEAFLEKFRQLAK